MNAYEKAAKSRWDELLCDSALLYPPPITAHLPIHPPHTPDFIHVEPSLGVVRRQVHPDLSALDQAGIDNAVESNPLFRVQFALGETPFLPDFRFTRLSLERDGYPLAAAHYWAYDTAYKFDYACAPIDQQQNLLAIHGAVTNEGEAPITAVVWINIGLQPEKDVDPYHYEPYRYDNRQWLTARKVSFKMLLLYLKRQPVARIVCNDFRCRWIRRMDFGRAEYKSPNVWQQPYYVDPLLRLAHMENVLRLECPLLPGESGSFELCVLTGQGSVSPDHRRRLKAARYADVAARARCHFRRSLPKHPTTLKCPVSGLDRIFTTAQISTLQLLVDFQKGHELVPTQGGSSERHFVWVWESLCMLMPMLALGHAGPVRRALEFIFKLQDGGCPPQGRFTSLEGAIGTTGPRWINSTGSALALAAEYCRYTRDSAFMRKHLPKMIRAADWIVREIRATRRLNTDGSRPLTYGLLPFGHATDGDVGFVYAFSDAYTFMGLSKTADLLAQLNHPRAAEFLKEVGRYRNDIRRTTQALARPSGWIERRIPVPGESITLKFETLIGPTPLAHARTLAVDSAIFRRFQRFEEEQIVKDSFFGNMDREIAYLGIAEWYWHEIYLRRGECKKAFLALMTYLNYAVAPGTGQVLERFSRMNPAFVPWQPNGSGNGRLLEMLVRSLCFMEGDSMLLLGCIPFAWLRRNGHTALRNLHTPDGLLNIEAVMKGVDMCRLSVSASSPAAMPRYFRLPDHFAAKPASGPLRQISFNGYQLRSPCHHVDFELTSAEE